jgi:hypothetical protein
MCWNCSFSWKLIVLVKSSLNGEISPNLVTLRPILLANLTIVIKIQLARHKVTKKKCFNTLIPGRNVDSSNLEDEEEDWQLSLVWPELDGMFERLKGLYCLLCSYSKTRSIFITFRSERNKFRDLWKNRQILLKINGGNTLQWIKLVPSFQLGKSAFFYVEYWVAR